MSSEADWDNYFNHGGANPMYNDFGMTAPGVGEVSSSYDGHLPYVKGYAPSGYDKGYDDAANEAMPTCSDGIDDKLYKQGYDNGGGKGYVPGAIAGPVKDTMTLQQDLKRQYDADPRAANLKDNDPQYEGLREHYPGGPEDLEPENMKPGVNSKPVEPLELSID